MSIETEIKKKYFPIFIEEDLDNCWRHYKSYFVDILNGDYDLEVAREDLAGLIGSEFDPRIKQSQSTDNQTQQTQKQ